MKYNKLTARDWGRIVDRMASYTSMVKVPTKHVALEPESFDVQFFMEFLKYVAQSQNYFCHT